MRKFWKSLNVVLPALALVGFSGCGGLWGDSGGGSSINVIGNIEDWTPATSNREIVVFVYRISQDEVDCEFPVFPNQNVSENNDRIAVGDTEYQIRGPKSGRLVIVYLLDNEGNDADRRIDQGDPIAVLNDPNCVLDDVPNKYTVNAEDVRMNFGLTDVNGFPAPGRAEAADLLEYPNNSN